MAEVTITISPEGNSRIAVTGVAGRGCHDLTEALERAIGTTTKDVKTCDTNRTIGQASEQPREMPA